VFCANCIKLIIDYSRTDPAVIVDIDAISAQNVEHDFMFFIARKRMKQCLSGRMDQILSYDAIRGMTLKQALCSDF
jgi:hypothetical protein